MGHTAVARKSLVKATPIVRRADGSVRQVLVIEDGEMTFCGYYAPGELFWKVGDDERLLFRYRCYHWADAFTDAQLAELGVQPDAVVDIRLAALSANADCVLVHREIQL